MGSTSFEWPTDVIDNNERLILTIERSVCNEATAERFQVLEVIPN